jgi:hypothetical protein
MPLLTPKKGEKSKDFVGRFMGHATAVKDFPDEKQRVAVAYQTYRDAKKNQRKEARLEQDSTIIPNVYILSQGEARGHDLFIDKTSIEKAYDLMAKAPNGVKVKMNHGSGLEAVLGFARNPRIEGDKLMADLHLLKSSPHYGLVKEMASEAPDQFGVSLAFLNESETINGKDYIRPQRIESADLVSSPASNEKFRDFQSQDCEMLVFAVGTKFRCWEGYKPANGVEPYAPGSCVKAEEKVKLCDNCPDDCPKRTNLDCGQGDDGKFGPNNTCAAGGEGASKEASPEQKPERKKTGPVQSPGPSDNSNDSRLTKQTKDSLTRSKQEIATSARQIASVKPTMQSPQATGSRLIHADNIKTSIEDFNKQTAGHKFGPTTERQKEYYRQTAYMLRQDAKKVMEGINKPQTIWSESEYHANEVADKIDKMLKNRSMFEESVKNLVKLNELGYVAGGMTIPADLPQAVVESDPKLDKKGDKNMDKKYMDELSELKARLEALEAAMKPADEAKDQAEDSAEGTPVADVPSPEDKVKKDESQMAEKLKAVLTEFGIKPISASPVVEAPAKVEPKTFEELVAAHSDYGTSKLKAMNAVMLSNPKEYAEARSRGITKI